MISYVKIFGRVDIALVPSCKLRCYPSLCRYPGSDFYDSTILQRGGGYKEAFEFRMAPQPTYGGALKGIGHTRSRRFLVVIFKWGKDKDCMFILTAYPAKRKHVEIYLRTTGGVL